MPWWDIDLTGLANFPEADQGSALASCNDVSGAPHLFYLANRKVIHGTLAKSALTAQTITPVNGPQVSPFTALCAFFDSYGGHVLYDALDNNGAPHVHQLTGAAWSDQALIQDTTTNYAVSRSGISSFLDASGNAHVFYIGGGSQHVQMLSFNDGIWTTEDLTTLASATKEATGASPVASFQDSLGESVFYIGADIYVHQLNLGVGAAQWVDQVLSAQVSNGSVTGAGFFVSGLSAFVDSYGEHVFYVSFDQHVHHLNFTASKWTDTDLTTKTSGPQAWLATALSGFSDGYGYHAVYISGDEHVHQMYYDNANWVDQDLTGRAKPVEESQVPLAAGGSALSSLANSLGELIFYLSADQHVHLLVFANTPPVPPLAVACPTASGEVGAPYNSSLVASRGEPPYTFTLTAGSLPPGLSPNNSTGAIIGTPTAPGAFNFTVSVTDASGATATTSCGITVAGPPTLECPTSIAQVGVGYDSGLVASGGMSPYTYAIASGSLPPGLTLNPVTGAITGTPTTANTFKFNATVIGASGAAGKVSCAILVESGVTVGCPAANTVQAGQPYSSAFVASGGMSPYTFAIASGSLPSGLTLNPVTGAITGTPTAVGTFNFAATATDATGVTATTSGCQITITATFVITAILLYPGTLQNLGPATALSFVNSQTNQPVTAVQNPLGTYTVSGVTNGEQLALSPAATVGFNLVTPAGIRTYLPIVVTLSGLSGSTTIYVEDAGPIKPKPH